MLSIDQLQSLSSGRRRLILAVSLALAAVFIVVWSVVKRSHSGFSVLYEVKVWDNPRPDGSFSYSYFPVAFASNHTFIAATDCDDRIVLIDLLTGRSQTPFPDGTDSAADSIALAPNDTIVAAGSAGQVRVWEIATRALIREFSLTEQSPVAEQVSRGISMISYPCSGVVVSRDSSRVVCRYPDENLIKIWNVETGSLELALTDMKNFGTQAFSRKGNLLALRNFDTDELSVWDVSRSPAVCNAL